MKKLHLLFVFAAVIFSAWALAVKADTGYEGAVRKEIGRFGNFRNVDASTHTGTALFEQSFNRADGVCFNNSAYTIWLGSSTRIMTANAPHPNFIDGFPILSSTTFNLDGSLTGAVYVTCNPGVTTCNIRCMDGLTK